VGDTSLGFEDAKAAARGGLKTRPGCGGCRVRAPCCTPLPGTGVLGCPALPAAPPCLSFPGLAGFARLCPGDQYEVRLRCFTVCLIAKEPKGRQISAAFYIAMNKVFSHQHPRNSDNFYCICSEKPCSSLSICLCQGICHRTWKLYSEQWMMAIQRTTSFCFF